MPVRAAVRVTRRKGDSPALSSSHVSIPVDPWLHATNSSSPVAGTSGLRSSSPMMSSDEPPPLPSTENVLRLAVWPAVGIAGLTRSAVSPLVGLCEVTAGGKGSSLVSAHPPSPSSPVFHLRFCSFVPLDMRPPDFFVHIYYLYKWKRRRGSAPWLAGPGTSAIGGGGAPTADRTAHLYRTDGRSCRRSFALSLRAIDREHLVDNCRGAHLSARVDGGRCWRRSPLCEGVRESDRHRRPPPLRPGAASIVARNRRRRRRASR
uniref:Uncharacterized protein n=1 Tax=Plectus sambesii TaxID=2011161 RepID=A0A914WMI6_9BILA